METKSEILEYSYSILNAGIEYEQDWNIRFAAAEALAACHQQQGESVLLEALDHASAGVRDRAVIALSHLKKHDYIAHLRPKLQDPDPLVRGHAIEALAKIQRNDCLQDIAERLSDENDFVKECAVVALTFLDTEHSHPILEDIAKYQENYDLVYPLRLTAAFYLGKAENKVGLEVLDDTLQDQDLWLAFSAACNFAELGYDNGVDILKKAAAEGEWDVKVSAIEHLFKLGETGNLEDTVFRPAEAPTIKTKIDAAILMDPFAPSMSQQILEEALEYDDENVQEYAIKTIGKLRRRDLLPLLEPLLELGREHIRAIATLTLEQIGTYEDIYLLIPVLLRSHWLLRLQAARVVINICEDNDDK